MRQLTPAREDVLKAVYALSTDSGPVPTGSVARKLSVSAPSASVMIRRLCEDGLLERQAGRRVLLTAAGERVALRIVRRHRLIETFLVRTLGLGAHEVHVEAERLEHATSERVADAMDDWLGRPTHDPHGKPIPQVGADRVTHRLRHLQTVPTGQEMSS